MWAATGSEAIRPITEDRLVHGLQHVPDRSLDDLFLDGRDPDRARLPLFLRDVHAEHRLVSVAHRLHPAVQVGDVALQRLAIVLLRDSIHAHRRILADPVIDALERFLVDEVRQRVEAHLRAALRSLHYLQNFR